MCECVHARVYVCGESELIQQMQAGATNRMRRRRESGVCERQQRRGLIALHHGLGNGRFAGGGIRLEDGMCACVSVCVLPCVCVCITITVYSHSAAEHWMIKDCVHAAYNGVSSCCLHLRVCMSMVGIRT